MALDAYPRAFIWDPLDGLSEVSGFGYEVAINDVNVHGVAVGWAFRHLGGGTFKEEAFVWDRVQGCRILEDFGYPAYARGINDLGEIVGWYWKWDESNQAAFHWRNSGDWSRLQSLYGGSAAAKEINNTGRILGGSQSSDPDMTTEAIWYPDGSRLDLGNLFTQHQNFAQCLNENGYVSGGTYGILGDIAYIWSPISGYTDIWNPFQPGLYITLSGINESLLGVGTMSVPNIGLKGFIRQTNGTIQLLNSLLHSSSAGWDIREAYDVNNKGQIAAVGWINGQRRGVMLQPVKDGMVISKGHR